MGNGNGSSGIEVIVRQADPQAGTPPGKDPKGQDPKDTERGSPPGKNPRLVCLADTVAMSSRQLNDDLYSYLRATENTASCCGGPTAKRLLRNLKASTVDLAEDLEALGKLLGDEEQMAVMAARLMAVAPGTPAMMAIPPATPSAPPPASSAAPTSASTEQPQTQK